MRRLKSAAAFVALTSGAIALFGTSPIQAAMLTTGASGQPSANFSFGGNVCADVLGGNDSQHTPVQAWDCHGGPNQQFEFNGFTIYALGGQGCVDVTGAGTADGTPVQFYPCNGGSNQQWYYDGGKIVNVLSQKCLDATNMENGTQLVIRTCDELLPASQTWQIK
jgi:chitinase